MGLWRWVFLERDGNGDGMAGSSIEERGEQAGENGRREKGKKREEEKKKSLKKELVKTFFLFDEECTVTLAFHL